MGDLESTSILWIDPIDNKQPIKEPIDRKNSELFDIFRNPIK